MCTFEDKQVQTEVAASKTLTVTLTAHALFELALIAT
jgi:hypothetical protein